MAYPFSVILFKVIVGSFGGLAIFKTLLLVSYERLKFNIVANRKMKKCKYPVQHIKMKYKTHLALCSMSFCGHSV